MSALDQFEKSRRPPVTSVSNTNADVDRSHLTMMAAQSVEDLRDRLV
jgi:hypothetical protein